MDAREHAYDPRIHRKKVFAKKMDRRVCPAVTIICRRCFSDTGGI